MSLERTIAKPIYLTAQKLRHRVDAATNPELEQALGGSVGAIGSLRARKVITLEEFNVLQIAASYIRNIRPIGMKNGLYVFADIYDLLLVTQIWESSPGEIGVSRACQCRLGLSSYRGSPESGQP